MRRRPSDDGELIPLELDGEDADEPSVRVVELGPRPNRRRDAVLVALVVVAVAAIGLLGGDDGPSSGPEEADAAPPTTVRRTTTTTTNEPQVTREAGIGPLLGTDTGSAVVVFRSAGRIDAIDLDRGDRCLVTLPRDTAGWTGETDGYYVHIHTARGQLGLDSRCGFVGLPAEGGATIESDRLGHRWHQEFEPGLLRLVEVRHDGERSGRVLEVPDDVGGFRGVDGGVVADIHGSVTFLDGDTGEAREIGTGRIIAGRGSRVAITECHAIDCRIVVRDLGGRLLGAVDARPAGWAEAALSPDGRWLAVQALTTPQGPHAVLLDLTTGVGRDLGATTGGPLFFTHDSSHLIGMLGEGLVAQRVVGDGAVQLVPPGRGIQSFVVIARS